MKRKLLLILFFLSEFILGDSKSSWTPQYGTVEYPKIFHQLQAVRQGDIFQEDGELFQAKVDGILDLNSQFWSTGDSLAWTKLEKGTYLYPKSFEKDKFYKKGDIYHIPHEDLYLRATENGELMEDFIFNPFGWELVNEKSNWMSLLRPQIGDRRLGDIALPGTHDTGTWGIDENSHLIDKNFIFQVAELVDGKILANWSLTQDGSMTSQLESGFRSFDMRIADLEHIDGSFRWWHGVAGDEIQDGLDEIVNFAAQHPEEIIILSFGHFAAPGDDGTIAIPDHRKDIIADTLISTLGPRLASKTGLSDNPTMNEVLGQGGNIIAIIKDEYIRNKHEAFWPNVIVSNWSGRTNTEDLFAERSSRLEGHLANSADRITAISGAVTPNQQIIVAGLIRVYGDDEFIRWIISIILPEVLDINPDQMSFEGLWMDLLTLGGVGVNTEGMTSRPRNLYSSGGSVQYKGVDDMWRHWLARPGKYKVNEIHIDDYARSTIVDTAIQANRNEIPRETSFTFQGSPLHGYYRWDENKVHALDGDLANNCSINLARYQITSSTYDLQEDWVELNPGEILTLQEGQYPEDAIITLQVSGDGATWSSLYWGNIQDHIVLTRDMYLRGTILEGNQGFGYVSENYNDYGPSCTMVPPGDDIISVYW